jgi:CRISPR/Cas system-associated exonuclease Cas4 (RecB family)
MNLPQNYLSVSQIRAYTRCSKQYEYKYIHQIKESFNSNLLLGRAFHKAIETSNRAKLAGDTLPLEAVKDAYNDAFESQRIDVKWKDDEKPDELKDQGLGLTSTYYEELGKNIQPEWIEQEFEIQIGDVPFKGFIDLTEQDGTIRDFKTAGRSPNDGEVYTNIQLVAYSMAYRELTGMKESKVGLDVVVKNKKPKVVRLEAEMTDNRIDRLKDTIENVAKGISAGIFYRNEDGPSSPCGWCSYKSICKGAK